LGHLVGLSERKKTLRGDRRRVEIENGMDGIGKKSVASMA
jgi:hypothetical protein